MIHKLSDVLLWDIVGDDNFRISVAGPSSGEAIQDLDSSTFWLLLLALTLTVGADKSKWHRLGAEAEVWGEVLGEEWMRKRYVVH